MAALLAKQPLRSCQQIGMNFVGLIEGGEPNNRAGFVHPNALSISIIASLKKNTLAMQLALNNPMVECS